MRTLPVWVRSGARVFLLFSILAILSVVLAACGEDEVAAPAAPAPAAPAPAAPAPAPVAPAAPAPAPAAPTAVIAAPVMAGPAGTVGAMMAGDSKFGGTATVVSQGSIKSLDRDFSGAYVSAAASLHLHEPLFMYDRDFNSAPQMIEDWSTSSDNLTLTFTIREDRMFHDGGAVTTKDIIPSLERYMIRHPAGEMLKNFAAEDAAVRLVAVDDRTFKLKLKEPYGSVVQHFGLLRYGPLIWPERIAVLDPFQDVGEENLIGSGPYKLDKWEVGNRVIYVRNEDYIPRTDPANNFGGAQIPYLERLIFVEIPSEETKIAGLKTGEWDVVDGPSLDFYQEMIDHPDFDVALDKPGKLSNLGIMHQTPPMDNLKIRQAMQAALHSEAIMASLGDPALWLLCPAVFHCGSTWESSAGEELYNQNDPEKAKRLMAEAGYDGEPITLINPTDYATITPTGAVIKAQLEAVGFNIDMPAMDWSSAVSRFGVRPDPDDPFSRDFHMNTGWMGFYGYQDPILFGLVGGVGVVPYQNDVMKDLRMQFARAVDPAEQTRLVDEINRHALETVMFIAHGQFFNILPYNKRLKGFPVSPPQIKGMPNYVNVWIE
jgi:peptide/nickel transport system substrate-binding protein